MLDAVRIFGLKLPNAELNLTLTVIGHRKTRGIRSVTMLSSDWPVHQLWPPPEVKKRTELDVVLFHGLQFTVNDISQAWSTTWTQRGRDDVCWPQEWLPFDLGEAVRIYSVSYNSHVTSPHNDVSEIAHNLLQIFTDRRYEWQHPIVLIGHSFGGLVLKSLVVKLKRVSTIRNPTNSLSKATVEHAEEFLRNVRGVAFYAVPHAGSKEFAEYVEMLLRGSNRHHPGIVDNIRPLQRDMEQLTVDFDRIVTENEINIYAFCECRPIDKVGILVDSTSARRSAEDRFYMVEDADHMEVCKPPSKEHPSYGLLLQFIIDCREVARECDQALQEVHDLPHPTFGLEGYLERVEAFVTSEGRNSAPHYVGIWGMGGVGKTLLLQTLYGRPKVKGHFQGGLFIWLTVGQTPDMMALYQNLSAKLGFRPGKTANLEDYKLELYNQFRHRRVFLVLDDVWQDKTFDSLNLAKGKGSVTLLSSRNQSLLERASPQIFMEQLTPLSKEDSWSLFRVHAFGAPSNIPDELNALAQTMAEECKGLPLALKVIGRAMIGKFSPELQWEPVLKQLRQSRMPERPVEEQLYMCLKLGYDALSEDDGRLKECFLSFAAFHENHNFSFPNILWLWIGEGWVPGNSEDDPSPDAFSLLKKLTERSLIESIELSDDLLFTDEEKFYTFKIHDVMRDMAFYILKKDSGAKLYNLYRTGQKLKQIPKEFLTMEVLSKVRRLSLYKNQLKELPENMYAPELISLLLGENIMQFAPQLSNFPKLRILDLYGADLDNLPEQLGDLENLVYLDLSECENLRNLPDTVWKLRNLKCLLLWGCSKLDYLPSGMTGLTSLQLLDTTNCDNLRWADHTLSGMPTIKASFEDICKLVALTNLMIWEVVKVPHNISALSNLKILSLQLRKMRTLPTNMAHWCIHLQQLEIEAGESLKHFPKSFTLSGSFPALIKFKIFCSGLIKFPEVEAGALSKLRTLQFAYCNSLKTLPLSLKLLTSLKNLILDTCPTKLEDFCLQNYEQTLC